MPVVSGEEEEGGGQGVLFNIKKGGEVFCRKKGGEFFFLKKRGAKSFFWS